MNRYLIIYEKGPRNYSAYCPDLPGCVSTGKTRSEVARNMREAIRFHLEGFKTPPRPSKAALSAGYVTV